MGTTVFRPVNMTLEVWCSRFVRL